MYDIEPDIKKKLLQNVDEALDCCSYMDKMLQEVVYINDELKEEFEMFEMETKILRKELKKYCS